MHQISKLPSDLVYSPPPLLLGKNKSHSALPASKKAKIPQPECTSSLENQNPSSYFRTPSHTQGAETRDGGLFISFFPGYHIADLGIGEGSAHFPMSCCVTCGLSRSHHLPTMQQQETSGGQEVQAIHRGREQRACPPEHALLHSKWWIWIIHFFNFCRHLLHPSAYFFPPGILWPVGVATSLSSQGRMPDACCLPSWPRQEAKASFQRKRQARRRG